MQSKQQLSFIEFEKNLKTSRSVWLGLASKLD